ncbi:50S ribosomal protein L3 [bacterium BMS3Bbin06]|nr:50S ribosomal protein L3 [bacterium BMS3Abin08]GBE34384.1 50S ribosomal protein L3 [bacterium BMS3Bbin06]
MTGILGKKLGMTQVFDEKGVVTPVTVVEAGPCRVLQVKTQKSDGYDAVQLGFDEIKKKKKVNKPMTGHFKKPDLPPYRLLREFRSAELSVGDEVTVERFQKGDRIAVSGVSKGKGFQGVMKRHNYGGGPGSHGSMFNRAPGSIGASAFPSKVWKNKGMPGRTGGERVTVKNLTVLDVRPEQNLLLIKGAIPGHNGSYIELRKED